MLSERPQRGRSCDYIRLGYHKYPIGRHLVFYRETADGIEIIRILHVSMDIERNFND